MALYSKTPDGVRKHGVKAIRTASGTRRIAELWIKTGQGPRRIYQSVRSCFGSGRWIASKPWLRNEKWKNLK